MTGVIDKVLLVIPVYNHPQRLREVVERALAVHPSVLVLDDGSEADPAPLLDGLPITLLRHERNLGKGAAMRTAAAHAEGLGKTHIVTIDADGQHFPEDLPRLIAAIEAEPSAVIIGVRDFRGSGAPGASRFGRSFGNFWVRVQTGTDVGDIQSGYRAYPVEVLRELRLFTKRYAFEVEIVVRALWAGRKVIGVPVRVFYPSKQERVSHFKGLRENTVLSVLNTHLTIRSIVPWPHPKLPPGATTLERLTVRSFLQSAKRLLSDSSGSGKLAWASATGIFLGTLPLIALHTVAILYASAFFRLNKTVAVGASQFCMPPVVPALCIETGYFLRHGRFLTLEGARSLHEAGFLELGHMGVQRLWEWLLGSLLVAPVLALAAGVLMYTASRTVRGVLARHE